MMAFLYDLLYCLPVSFLSVIYTARFTGSPDPTVPMFIAAGLFCMLFAGLLRVKGWIRLIIVLVLPLQLFLFLLIFREPGERIPYLLEHIQYFWVFVITFLSFLAVKLSARLPGLKAVITVLFFALLAICMIRKEEMHVLAVALTMLLLLLAASEGVRILRFRLRETDERTKKYLVCLSPFFLLLFLVLLFYRAPEKAYGWDFAKRIYADVATAVDHIKINLFQGSSGSYENAEVGFSDEAIISGSVRANTRDVMIVDSNVNQKYQLYLAGKSFNVFNGRNWESESSSELNETTLDTVESYASVLRYDPEYISDYMKPRSIKIGYRYFNSSHMFHPLKSVIIPDLVQEFEVEFYSGNVAADHRISYEDDYSVNFYRTNRSSSLFRGLLKDRSPLSEAEWTAGLDALGITESAGVGYEDYKAYREMIRADYTEAPVLTERTETLMTRLMEGAETQLEQMNRLEAFLQSFDYDVQPGGVPDRIRSSGEYLDYFLFENPRGYCNYFATAMVLLARSQGYPARYVQGYYTTLLRNARTIIKSDQAHAWAEIYFDGFGWIAYEATPGFHIESTWTISSEKEGKGSTEGAGSIEYLPEEEIELPEDLIDLPTGEDLPEENGKETASSLLLVLMVLLLGVAAAAVLLGIVLLMRKLYFQRQENGKKLRILFRRNMSLLEANGLSLEPGETLQEFRERVSAYLFSEEMTKKLKGSAAQSTVSDALVFLDDYEQAIFADRPVTVRTIRNSEVSNRKLLSVTGRTRGLLLPLIYIRSVFR